MKELILIMLACGAVTTTAKAQEQRAPTTRAANMTVKEADPSQIVTVTDPAALRPVMKPVMPTEPSQMVTAIPPSQQRAQVGIAVQPATACPAPPAPAAQPKSYKESTNK